MKWPGPSAFKSGVRLLCQATNAKLRDIFEWYLDIAPEQGPRVALDVINRICGHHQATTVSTTTKRPNPKVDAQLAEQWAELENMIAGGVPMNRWHPVTGEIMPEGWTIEDEPDLVTTTYTRRTTTTMTTFDVY